MGIRYNVIWPTRAGMTKPLMSAADKPSLLIILAKSDQRQTRIDFVRAPQLAGKYIDHRRTLSIAR
jgi:hypothetical protein